MAISYRRSTYIPTTSQQLHVTIMRVEKLSCSLVYSRPHPLPTRQDRCAAHTARDRICTAAARRAGQSSMEETTARRSMDGAGAQACRGSEARRGERPPVHHARRMHQRHFLPLSRLRSTASPCQARPARVCHWHTARGRSNRHHGRRNFTFAALVDGRARRPCLSACLRLRACLLRL